MRSGRPSRTGSGTSARRPFLRSRKRPTGSFAGHFTPKEHEPEVYRRKRDKHDVERKSRHCHRRRAGSEQPRPEFWDNVERKSS